MVHNAGQLVGKPFELLRSSRGFANSIEYGRDPQRQSSRLTRSRAMGPFVRLASMGSWSPHDGALERV